MNNSHVINITAVTEVFPEGQKCTGVLLEYDSAVYGSSVRSDAFQVKNRTITDAWACKEKGKKKAEKGKYVYLSLSAMDEKAPTYFPGSSSENLDARIISPKISVSQTQELLSENGRIPPAGPDTNGMVENLLVDEFLQGSYAGLSYNLFIPKNYDPSKKYPLVQFIHDAAVCSKETRCTLAQGVGALVWMTEEAQARQECFVLAPQFARPTIVDDDWNVDHRLEVEKRLLDQICSEYSVDEKRIYTTGQSMGCMSSMVLNLRYPDLFAASLFVAGQWDEKVFHGSGLEKKHFWFINSQGDAKAFPGMNQILVELEKDGAKIAREVWDAKEEQDVFEQKTKALLDTGANIIYTPFEMTSIAEGWQSDGGEHHIHTWRYAYGINAIREWLFSQQKG